MKILNFTTNEKLSRLASGKLAKTISTDGEWAVGLTDKDLATLGAIIQENDLDDEIKVDFEDTEIDFEINRASKFIYLTYLSNKWESERSFEYSVRTMSEIEQFEKKFGRSAIHFNEDQIVETINGLGNRTNFYGLKFRIKVLKEYYDFYSKDLGLKAKDNGWTKYYNSKVLSNVLDGEEKTVDLTKQNLIDLFNSMTNPQQGIVPLLIFEGLNFSKNDEVDEIRNLETSNVHSTSLFIPAHTEEVDGKGFRLSVDREIDVDSDVMKCIAKAISSDSIVRVSRHSLDINKLAQTPYVLRGIVGRKEKSSNTTTLSYGATYDRLQECREQYESYNVELDDFSAKYISMCGKSCYIYKYMDEGQSETEAIINTLKRFGEWNTIGNHKEDIKLDTNKIRIARLRRSYAMYRNEKKSNS